MSIDLRLYLVTDPAYGDLDHIVSEAVAGGVTCVQVRDKAASQADLAATVRRLRKALPAEVAVLANDDVDAAGQCDGLHVGVDDLPPARARELLGSRAVIGWSINDLAQLDDETELAACDYVAASPVWSTPTKTDTGAPFGLVGVSAIAERLRGRLPLVAIGGIDVDNASQVVAAGADGVAVVSAICGADDLGRAAAQLLRVVDEARRTRGALL